MINYQIARYVVKANTVKQLRKHLMRRVLIAPLEPITMGMEAIERIMMGKMIVDNAKKENIKPS